MTDDRRRKNYRALIFCMLWLSPADGFHPSASTIIRGPPQHGDTATCNHRFQINISSLRMTKRRMVSQSVDRARPTNHANNSNNLREIEQQIVNLGRAGKTDEALSIYQQIEQPTIRLVNGAIDACSRARPTRLNQAFDIFQGGVDKHALKPNVFTFGALMNACNRDRNGSKALALLASMKTDYGVIPNAVVYSSAISACARSQPAKSEQALQLLKEAVEENELPMNVVGFNAAISACSQAGDWENAINILARMEDAAANNTTSYLVPAPDAITYGTVLAACEKAEEWDAVLRYAKEMTGKGLQLDGLAVTSCLHACQQLGRPNEAMEYLNIMKSLPKSIQKTARFERSGARQPLAGPDDVAYRLAISACARGGAWKEGIRLLEEYKGVTENFSDVVAYTAAITGCEYAGQWKEALFLLDKMRKDGVNPNEVTVAAVLGACATACSQAGYTQRPPEMPTPQVKALQLLEIVKNRPDFVKPNIQVYNAAIRVCAEAHDMQKAFALLEEVEDAEIGRTLITYGSMMTACERVGCVESASKVFRKLKEDGFEPNEIVYGAAISCCRKAKQSERAMLLLKKMMKEGLSPNVATFNTVMMAQAEGKTRGDTERAILVYRLMKSKFANEDGRPNRQTYRILIMFFAAVRQPVTAETFLSRMREDGYIPDVDLFTATVAAYERAGQPLRALKLMESMQEDGYDFYGVTVLNEAFKKALKLANRVGQTFTSREDGWEESEAKFIKLVDEDDDEALISRK